jgi:hypothetical protein
MNAIGFTGLGLLCSLVTGGLRAWTLPPNWPPGPEPPPPLRVGPDDAEGGGAMRAGGLQA